MTETKKTLPQLRQEIDVIDLEIIASLQKRAGIVKEVGTHKRGDKAIAGNRFIQAAREADMLRNILAKEDVYHPAIITAIWRAIISGSLLLEEDLDIAILTDDISASGLAIEYFTRAYQITSYLDISELTKRMLNQEHKILVISTRQLAQMQDLSFTEKLVAAGINIFAQLPLISGDSLPEALAFSKIELQKSQQDKTIFYASKIVDFDQELFAKEYQIISSNKNDLIFSKDGFAADKKIGKFEKFLLNITQIGGFAKF
jgi:chorismate mutase